MTDTKDITEDGEDSFIALEPAQVGALVALALSVLLIWWAVRRSTN